MWYNFHYGIEPRTVINRIYGNYLVKYIKHLPKTIKYVFSEKMNVSYLPNQSVLNIKYLREDKSNAVYLKPESIKIIYKCKQ
jgi:hypothetical protein